MGWRYLLYSLGAITLLVFILRFVVFHFQEFPKFPVCRGQDAKAIKVLDRVTKPNSRKNNLTIEIFEALQNEDSMAGESLMLGSGSRQRHIAWCEMVKLEF
jgi:hypothetical protein